MACCFNTLLFCLKYIVGMKTQWKAVTSYWCKKRHMKKLYDYVVWMRMYKCVLALLYIYIMFIWRVWEFYCKKYQNTEGLGHRWMVEQWCWSVIGIGLGQMECRVGVARLGYWKMVGLAMVILVESGIRSHWGICQCQLAGPIYIARAVGVKKRTKVGQGVGVGEDLLQSSSWLV